MGTPMGTTTPRARRFTYVGLDVTDDTLTGHFDLDGRAFHETVVFEGAGSLRTAPATAVAHLWYLLAGLSYYKVGAPPVVDLGATPVGPRGVALVRAALVDGLGEFAYRNSLTLDDVVIEGGLEGVPATTALDPSRVLVPFGGGIDSVVSVETLPAHLDQTLFIVSPARGRFAALDQTAAVTGRPILRATRALDPQVLRARDGQLRGHVPVTAMITLLAAVAAVSSGRGGVVMSNEHSASVPNLRVDGREVNHQWSKSLAAEELLGAALDEAVGASLTVASLLRDRSELWVAEAFSRLPQYLPVFRSCNRAFAQDPAGRATAWCGECDKCLFIDLVLAPFVERATLRATLGVEPLSDPGRVGALADLVGLGEHHKPFECVGDPDESATALAATARLAAWRDVPALAALAARAPSASLDELLEPRGPTRAPAHWLR
ncbi:MAG: hypothetical protein ACP5PB_09655 [Acidimicrobiales bacterium]